MRLIDADALEKRFGEECEGECPICIYNNEGFPCGLIKTAPTVDITEEQAIDKLHETSWMQKHDKEMTKRPRKSKRKPKCTNFSNCGDCVHAEFVWEGVTFRGIRCLKGCK